MLVLLSASAAAPAITSETVLYHIFHGAQCYCWVKTSLFQFTIFTFFKNKLFDTSEFHVIALHNLSDIRTY